MSKHVCMSGLIWVQISTPLHTHMAISGLYCPALPPAPHPHTCAEGDLRRHHLLFTVGSLLSQVRGNKLPKDWSARTEKSHSWFYLTCKWSSHHMHQILYMGSEISIFSCFHTCGGCAEFSFLFFSLVILYGLHVLPLVCLLSSSSERCCCTFAHYTHCGSGLAPQSRWSLH